MIKKKHIIISIIILILIIVLIVLSVLHNQKKKQATEPPEYADFIAVSENQGNQGSVSGDSPETPAPPKPINISTEDSMEIGNFVSDISDYDNLKVEKVVDDEGTIIYVKDMNVGDDGFMYSLVTATRVFDGYKERPATIDDARSGLEDYVDPYTGVAKDWDEAEKYFVRKTSYFDSKSDTAQITYTLLPKGNANDDCLYVAMFITAENRPLSEDVFSTTMKGLIDMAGPCSFFDQSFEQVSQEMDDILYYQSATKCNVSYTALIVLDAQRQGQKEMEEENEQENQPEYTEDYTETEGNTDIDGNE